MRLGVCSRSGDVIEQLVKPQWFVRLQDGIADPGGGGCSGEIFDLFCIEHDELCIKTDELCIQKAALMS